MAFSTFLLILGLLVSGVCIPLLLTFQNHQTVHQDDEPPRLFYQPLLQTVMIFMGEIVCILLIHLLTKTHLFRSKPMFETVQPQQEASLEDRSFQPLTSWSTLTFLLPSVCDLAATTLTNLGLLYSTPSVFQMVRSSIVGLSAISSALFLSRRFLRHEWAAVAVLLTGTALIAWSSAQVSWEGPLCLLAGQVFVAGQFVLEEHLMEKHNLHPVRAMGIEGVFGSGLIVVTLLVAGGWGNASSAYAGGIFDITTGYQDLVSHPHLWLSAVVLSLVVAVFNFFGLAVGASVGVPGRSTIDMLRIIVIWGVAIYLGWDAFHWLELGGFVLLGLGTFVFNGVLAFAKHGSEAGESAPLLV